MHISRHRAVNRVIIGLMTATFFSICFTSRLIPAPFVDRAVFVSVAEYLLSGDRLYTDVYDNKDPLFFYAVAAQRLLGPAAEYLFELLLIAVSAVSAYAIACVADRAGISDRVRSGKVLLIAVPLLLTGVFWLPGYTTLPGTALCLLACALFLRQKMLLAGGCIGLVAFTKLIMLPLPVVFCFSYELVLWKGHFSRQRFSRMTAGFLAVCAAVAVILLSRGEAAGYLQAQKNNFLYSNGVLFGNGTFLESFVSHLRVMFLGEEEKLCLLFSLIASMGFSGFFVAQPGIGKRTKAFIISSLVTCVMAVIVLGLTGIWKHHLQLLYFSQTLMLICIAIGLGPKDLGLKQVAGLRQRMANALYAIALIFSAVVLSGTLSPYQYLAAPDTVVQAVILRTSNLVQASPETKALQAVYPDGIAFARLGQNSTVIPYGAANDSLICPEFGQYPFYSPERLNSILECAKTAPTLVVDDSFTPLKEIPKWWPRDAQKDLIVKNWNGFVTAGENLIQTQYVCQRLENVRVCDSVEK
ncbi:MAG: hypothetical protein WA883_09690 [Phormidesmis sp.]